MKLNIKKASSEVGIGIIVLSILLLLGGIFIDYDDSNSKSNYYKNKNSNNKNNNGFDEHLIFVINETDIGRQRKVVTSFPNIELGSKEEYNTIYAGNSFRLNANMFTSSKQRVDFSVKDYEEINEFLIYLNGKRITGEADLIVKVNGETISQNKAKSIDIPIRFNNILKNNSGTITFELKKPRWYEIFNWNKFDIRELKILEVRRDHTNNKREFDFDIDKENLERLYIDLVITCDEIKETSSPIKVSLNGYIIGNQNPKCASKYNKITINEISKNILKDNQNRLEFETNGFYKVAYSLNKIYFNDQSTYKFTMENFNDIIDVVMYGDFDKEIIDIKLNNKIMTLNRDEIKSIYQYLRYGTNEIEFLNKPLEIKEFKIEKTQFY
ncbi:MAG: hypothetical protein KC589_00215 [Nanoarchaeota archaeon]|nr:hypothetical protein [Nanoarchaeota archaeon]